MRVLALAFALAFAATTALIPDTADARRLGGGGSAGMQRTVPPRAPTAAPPAQPAAPAATPQVPATTAAAAAAPRRSWLGPIAGIAAGLGIAALMSHLGLGAAFGEFLTLLLLGLVAIVAIRFVMRRFAAQPAGAQLAGAGAPLPQPATFGAGAGIATGAGASAPAAQLPRDFDAAGFERIAKMIFIRLQAANDSGDLGDLRAFTTPEMFAAIKLELQERRASQRTDVVRVDAEVLDVASEPERQIVSVRFHGMIQDDGAVAPEAFDEVWHLVKPADGSREWAIAGIQPTAPALASVA